MEIEADEVEEADERGSEDSSILEESSRDDRILRDFSFVEGEGDEDERSENKKHDDLVAAPWQSAAAVKGQIV